MRKFLVKTKEFFMDFKEVTLSGCIKRLVLYIVSFAGLLYGGYELGYQTGLEINTIKALKKHKNDD